MRTFRLLVSAGLLLGLVAPLAAAPPVSEPLVEQVRKAIDHGIRYLSQQEAGKGNWEQDPALATRCPGGETSLATLALLTAGVKPTDPIIQRALDYLRRLEPRHTYVVGLQTMVFAEAGFPEDRERIQRNVNWLVNAAIKQGDQLTGWTYGAGGGGPDNSNTQYALLGLHAGKTAGAHIDPAFWAAIRDFYIRTQHEGGWTYRSNFVEPPRLTMTTAGLCGLLIAGMEAHDSLQRLRPDGSAENCGQYKENQAVQDALRWLGRNLRIREYRSHLFYNLYGIERAGRLSGQRFFGEHDWYRKGCEFLVSIQNPGDGSWADATGAPGDNSPIIATSFALLFLGKGRTPILISKLVHGPVDNPTQDWNNKHHDARHLVEYASRELFKKQPLAWQVFDARRVDADTDEQLRGLVGDLLQSPIAYFNGHRRPSFAAKEKEMLRRYVQEGGFVLAEACCGSTAFDQGFRELMRELFPDTPLRPLPPEHPLWRAHAVVPPGEFRLEGIELGCKTVVVYSPQPLAGYWEANQWQSGRGQLAFRLGGNIIAYATGLEMPKPRLTPHEVLASKDDSRKAPRGFLKVAQLRHEGDWQPAPRAMRNLMLHLREKNRLDVVLQPEELRPNHPDLFNFKLLYLHGRHAFTLDDQEVENLRANLTTGGLLFSDAACGRAAFDDSFRALVARLFPDRKLEPIPLTDVLYSGELNGQPITTVRCRREGPDGQTAEPEYREVPPYLEGIKLGNRWVVIYSKYDIGCALEKHRSPNCKGHDPASALRLATAAVLYALYR